MMNEEHLKKYRGIIHVHKEYVVDVVAFHKAQAREELTDMYEEGLLSEDTVWGESWEIEDVEEIL